MLEKLPDAVGHALRNMRAGLDKIAFNLVDLRAGTARITVTSLAFHDHGRIPALYTADGTGTSPPLAWTGVPAAAASLILIVEDADAPTPHPLVHAIAAELAPTDGALVEGALDDADEAADGMHIGRNSYLQAGWLPPDPPPGHGTHRYAFQIFALEPGKPLSETPGREAVLNAIKERGIASGHIIGTYERPDSTIPVQGADPAAEASGTPGVAGPV